MPYKQETPRFRFDNSGHVVREPANAVEYNAGPRAASGRPFARKHASLKAHAIYSPASQRVDRHILAAAIRDVKAQAQHEAGELNARSEPSDDTDHLAALIRGLTDGAVIPPAQQRYNKVVLLLRAFQLRRQLLKDALTTKQVADMLGASRQMPLDRLKAGNLVAVRDGGDWRFPSWQFDPEGPDGVVRGLPTVIAALPTSPMLRVGWLSTLHPALGMAPIDALRTGRLDRVLSEAQAVGAN
ncbi:MAG: hypothetical protein JWO59_3272 [Chloroflexi bacterium]|nr:hypothetical protein [Chloroflexota bacterium]